MPLHKRIWNWLFGPRCEGCGRRGAKRKKVLNGPDDAVWSWTTQCDHCFKINSGKIFELLGGDHWLINKHAMKDESCGHQTKTHESR